FGMNVVALGPDVAAQVVRALKANHIVALLCDRDIGGAGVDVEFFGERTTLPAGPATLALRTGAALLPTAVYYRGRGHLGVCRGPWDGPPPDGGGRPLGRSVPTTATGSVAPIAPDPSCQLRTIRALRDEGFDVLHLHEPLVPGPCMTSILFRNAPIIGTFHAA